MSYETTSGTGRTGRLLLLADVQDSKGAAH